MKILFAGTPSFAATILEHMIAAGFKPDAVWTQPDRPKGRGKKLEACATKQLALEHGIACFSPISLKKQDACEEMAAFAPDLLVVAAYGLILPQKVLDIPRFGCINVHASLLPLWRGAAPIARSLWQGDKETGVTLMQMDAGLDTGDIIQMEKINILDTDNGQTLHDKLAKLGGQMMVELLHNWPEQGQPMSHPQPAGATYAHKLDKKDGQINWQQDAASISRQIRALYPWPGTFAFCQGKRIKIVCATALDTRSNAKPGTILDSKDKLLVATGQGVLNVTTLQLPGKKATPWDAMKNGQTILADGDCFGADANEVTP